MEVKYEMGAPEHNKTKITATYFRDLTKCFEVTSEQCRDAAVLVFGY
jgi:hypothetical protein